MDKKQGFKIDFVKKTHKFTIFGDAPITPVSWCTKILSLQVFYVNRIKK